MKNSTVMRFQIKLSDVDRGIYDTLELRVACHPSESAPFLLTRVIAYALNVQEGIEFTAGIATPDEPAICIKDLTGQILCWIDIGNPTARRLHKASKTAKSVRIYTYRDIQILLDEMKGQDIHRIDTIEIFALTPAFLAQLEATLEKDNRWDLLLNEGELSITIGEHRIEGELLKYQLR